jgi:hypothetical protein
LEKVDFQRKFSTTYFTIKKTFEQPKAVDSLFNFLKKYLID